MNPAINARDTLVMRSSAAPLQSSHLVALWSGSAGRHHDPPDVAPAGTAIPAGRAAGRPAWRPWHATASGRAALE
jgi:hypothetical protein